MYQMLTLRSRKEEYLFFFFLLGINQKSKILLSFSKGTCFYFRVSHLKHCDEILVYTTPTCTALRVKHVAYSSSPHLPQDVE